MYNALSNIGPTKIISSLCRSRSRRQVFLPFQHTSERALDAFTWKLRALRAAGHYRALGVEALFVETHCAAIPLLLEQARLRPQPAEVDAQRRFNDRRQARKR